MTLIQWFIFFLIVQVIHFAGTWKLYQKAGRKPWEALIPVYNAIVLMKIINRPTWWVILLFIPIVNLIMFPVVWVEILRSFGKNKTADTILGVVTLGLYIYYINYAVDVTYIPNRSLKPTTSSGETVSSILFAVVVATLIHTYIVQPFTIPTSSLEKTLLVGDFLFVSKINYGPRTPMTTVALPMVHDSIPFTKSKSYLVKPHLPYFRIPGFQKVQHNDIVVFNWPVDTVYAFRDKSGRRAEKPVDKKSNYVKRTVGLPGESFEVRDGVVFTNGKELQLNDRAKLQYAYKVTTDGSPIDQNFILKDLKVTDQFGYIAADTLYFTSLTMDGAERLKTFSNVKEVTRIIDRQPSNAIFPHTKNWTQDNLGPIPIPYKGEVVKLNSETLPFYKQIIKDYENNSLETHGENILINGQPATEYTIKQDYYFMMGDNRHNSEDSRYWGFVPEDHIVGKPVFVWMSLDQNIPWGKAIDKIRWERMFTTVGGNGEPVSYFKYFLIIVIGWFGYDFYKKRKAKRNS
ncbi:signal peptidase I [Flavobacterium sp. NKUCC04_CG]|uniref:signal peptidase I n=1 Tax=Flavobacterium sp. NKUCC04_CG TaxID=2842121 RepID=UPI001C5B2DA5|nr:signal peptidase I [Flavobacterium sp. NKUCC04_CG]MBW3519382.1 signal peptidase I [Flavobacterium sp. NKUCC04_CG]